MAQAFGQLLYLTDKKTTDDPYKGELIVYKLGVEERRGVYHFDVPEDKRSLKIENCMFVYDIDIDSNFVPDNGFHAKMVKRWLLLLNDTRVFDSFDLNEYTWFNHFKTKLNKSDETQCLDMFPSGHFDDRDLDAAELSGKRLLRNGKTLVDNRQQYGKKIWKKGDQKITISEAQAARSFDYERLSYRYSIRAPIAHGLASQPRVIPALTKTAIELEFNDIANSHMQISDYQECRIPFESIEDYAEIFKAPFSKNLKTLEKTAYHNELDQCDCVEKADTYDSIDEIGEDGTIVEHKEEGFSSATLYAVSTGTGGATTKAATWKKHRVTWSEAETGELSVPDPDYPADARKNRNYTTFFWKHEISPKTLPKVENLMFEMCFVNSGAHERPLTNGQKGVGVIPFMYPKMTTKKFPENTRSMLFNIHQGVFPQLIILTGMPSRRYNLPILSECPTKTSMVDPDFKIVEFVVYINHRVAFRTPWTEPLDHYLNMIKANGRLSNVLDLGGGMDFEKFKSENWMVPLVFDDDAGLGGLIDVKITFEKDTPERWDFMVMKVPVEELHIDRERKSI